jgi:CHAT domain-containing protein/lipopolysaccharide biosynthesis regulator YciM
MKNISFRIALRVKPIPGGLFFSRLILLCLFLTVFLNTFSQDTGIARQLKDKAYLCKNRVQYDSALYYFNKLDSLLPDYLNDRRVIVNKLDICDVSILARDFAAAERGIEECESAIALNFSGDLLLESTLLQVKGSYYQASNRPDSAMTFLYESIAKRIILSGKEDTLLHYAYNKLGNLYISQSDFDSAYICHKTALDLSLKKNNPVNYLSASSYQNVGIAAQLKGDYQLAAECYTKSLQLKEQLFNKDDPGLAKIYWNLGKFYTDLSKYNTALEYYDKSEQLLSSSYQRDNFQFAHVYWNKGNVYTHKGDYTKATSYLSRALSILESTYGSDNLEVSKVLLDLGFAYNKQNETELAIEYYNRAATNKNNANIIKIYRNLGNIYMALNKLDSAEKYYAASIESARRIFSGNSYDLALCYQYYGAFIAKNKLDNKAEWYYSQAAEIFIQLFGKKNKDLSKVYRLEGEFYSEIDQFDSALVKLQTSLIALLPGFNSEDIYTNPNQKEFILDPYLQEALSQKASTLYLKFNQSKNIKDLIASLEVIDLTIIVTEEIRKTFNEEESQLILNKLAGNVFDLGVLVSQDLYSLTNDTIFLKKSFQYSEKGQAIILLSALRGLEAQSYSDIPAELKTRENDITKELATYNSFLYQERQRKTPDQSKIQLWSNEVFNLRLSHDSILSLYKNEYPDYFRLKFDYSSITADSILSGLQNDQAIIEYCLTDVNDSLVFGFILTDHKISVQKLGYAADLKVNLDTIRQIFARGDFLNAGQKELEEFTTVANNLYNFLIRPFEKEIVGKRLIIIPDGELGYLSFDLLLHLKPPPEITSWRDLPWLIKSNPISYSSSATIFFEQIQHKKHKSSQRVLAFAPSYNFTSSQRNAGKIDSAILKLNPMIGTKEEIEMIAGLFRTKKLEDEHATETYFKDHAGKYSILHLAMHTIIDNENPMYSKLVFTPTDAENQDDDGYLNTYELFNLQLPGHLAVLSACNTGSGKLERGEGIISLARGFFYAGIPSVVMTLWEIEDHSSADLMALFYKNLKDNLPYDIALQKAKIDYLENAGKLQSHPYFWAGYVNIGKTGPVGTDNGRTLKTLVLPGIIALSVIILIIIFINRRVFFPKKRY